MGRETTETERGGVRAASRLGLLVLLLLGGVAGVVAPGSAGEHIEGNVYANDEYGVRIAKPPSWHFITAGTVVELAKKMGGGAPIRGEEDPVKLAGFAVIVSKVPSVGREVAPQVIVLVQELAKRAENLVETCEGLRSGMTEPQTVRETRVVDLAGQPAARLDFQGLVDGAMVRATALCAIRERRAVVAVGQALASEFQSEFSTFEQILSSFRLD